MAEKSRRGFAAMNPAKQREIASKGGKAAHAKGRAHEFTPEQAREAGRKGGLQAHANGTAHKFSSQQAEEAARIRTQRMQERSEQPFAGAPVPQTASVPSLPTAGAPLNAFEAKPAAVVQPGTIPAVSQTANADTNSSAHNLANVPGH
jgi:general stress protein YciG